MTEMDTKALHAILPSVSTPSYIFDLDVFRARARLVREAFGEKIGMCFSIKANPFLLRELPDEFDRIEVCSPGELSICESTHADMSKVIFSGVNKGRDDILRAMDDGVGVFTAESMLHLEMIHAAALERGRCVPLLLRVTDAAGGSQFGMDELDVLDIIRRRDEYPGVTIVGLHYFTGTGKRKARVIGAEIDYLIDLIGRLKAEFGFQVERIEYGTGLAVDYFSADADALEAERLADVLPKLHELAALCALTVEMGRFFAAPCGYYLTKIVDVKVNRGIRYAIVDGGMHQVKYDGQLQGMQTPVIRHIRYAKKVGTVDPWCICGSLCTTADVLVRSCELESPEIGDVLVFCRTGAYSCMEGMSLFLSRDLPAVFFYSVEHGVERVRAPYLTAGLNTPVLS